MLLVLTGLCSSYHLAQCIAAGMISGSLGGGGGPVWLGLGRESSPVLGREIKMMICQVEGLGEYMVQVEQMR